MTAGVEKSRSGTECMAIPIACAQVACTTYDTKANLEKADDYIHRAARQGARIIVLPEFLPTGCTYDHKLCTLAEPIGGPTTAWLQRRSRQNNCWIAAGIIEEADGTYFDTLLMTGPGGEVLSYRKQFPAFFENLYFSRGQVAGIFNTSLGRVGVMLCWDMVQPSVYRSMEGRVDLIVICSAWPDIRKGNIPLYWVRGWIGRQPEHRPRKLAKKLNVPVAYCNMTGPFHTAVPWLGLTYRSVYTGASSIHDAGGTPVAVAEVDETLIVGEVRHGKTLHRQKAA